MSNGASGDLVTTRLKRGYGLHTFGLLLGATKYPFMLAKRYTGFNETVSLKNGLTFLRGTGAFTSDQVEGASIRLDEDTNELMITVYDEAGENEVVHRFGNSSWFATADSAALTGSSEAVFSTGSFTVPAASLSVGVYEFYARVKRTGVNSTDTSRTRVRFGPTTLTGTVLADSTALATVANDYLEIRGFLEIRDLGATGHILAGSKVEGLVLTSPAETVKRILVDSTVLDTTAALLFEVTNVMSSASASNTAVLKAAWLKKVA